MAIHQSIPFCMTLQPGMNPSNCNTVESIFSQHLLKGIIREKNLEIPHLSIQSCKFPVNISKLYFHFLSFKFCKCQWNCMKQWSASQGKTPTWDTYFIFCSTKTKHVNHIWKSKYFIQWRRQHKKFDSPGFKSNYKKACCKSTQKI